MIVLDSLHDLGLVCHRNGNLLCISSTRDERWSGEGQQALLWPGLATATNSEVVTEILQISVWDKGAA